MSMQDSSVLVRRRRQPIPPRKCADKVWGERVTEKLVWHVVKEFALKIGVAKLAAHDPLKLRAPMPGRWR